VVRWQTPAPGSASLPPDISGKEGNETVIPNIEQAMKTGNGTADAMVHHEYRGGSL
jgi:hypothetical protein